MPKSEPARLTIMVTFDDGRVLQESTSYRPGASVAVSVDAIHVANATIDVEDTPEQIREYSKDMPVALDQRDPGNTDPDELTEALDADDDVYTLINQGES